MRSTSSKVLWVVVVANVLTALIAIVTNVATGVLPDAWQPYLWIAWPVLAALVLSGIPLVIYLRRIDAGHPAVTDDRAEFSRKAMLAQVRTMWVNGVLTQSLYQQTLVELGLEERPGFLRRPWDMMLETADQRPRPVEPGTRLVDVVERYRGLLMLGAPGAGKTTMLLTLLEDLLDVATRDKTAPIPVVFPLANWSSDSKPLEEWFVEELCGPLYGLSPELARSWIANDRVLPLLDGLDEVVLDKRLACAQAIEAFHRTHRLLPLVVASRIADYNALGLRFSLGTALLIQPLTQTQVQDYLGQFGEPMAGLREALAGEPALWDLLRTPFLLNVAVRAYHGLPAEDVATEGPTQQRQSRLIAAYVERAVRRKPHGPRFAPSDVVRWLAYCARWMGKNLELFFFVESVNSNWLPKRLRRRVITVTALPASVLLGGSAGLLLHLFIDTWTGIVLGLLATIGFGLGLSTGHGGEVAHASGGNRRALLMEYLGEWAFLGVFGALGLGFAGGAFGALVGTIVGVVGVITGDGSFFAAVIDKGVAGLLIGAVLGVLLPMVQTWGGDRQALRNRPSGAGLRDAVWLCGTSFLVVCVPVTAILGVFYGPDGAVTGVVFGGTAAYLFGGRGLATYWLTRRVLVHGGITPSRPLAFLDFAVAHTLMLRVGGGYMFAHRLLLEHFASLQPEDVPKHYVHEGLSVIDLRPETLLARTVDDARTATPGDAVQAVTYTGSVLPATVWAPSAMKVAETLRARVPATLEPSLYAGGHTPQSRFYETALRAAADVLRMVIAAQHDDLSLVASFQLGDLLTTPVPGVFDSAYDWRDPYMDDAVASLRAITTRGDAALARRAVEMLDKLVITPPADQG